MQRTVKDNSLSVFTGLIANVIFFLFRKTRLTLGVGVMFFRVDVKAA